MTPSNQMVNSIILNPLISRLNRLNNGNIWDNYIELCLMDSRNVFNLSKATTKECPRYEVSLNQQSFSPILILQNEPRPLKLFFFLRHAGWWLTFLSISFGWWSPLISGPLLILPCSSTLLVWSESDLAWYQGNVKVPLMCWTNNPGCWFQICLSFIKSDW